MPEFTVDFGSAGRPREPDGRLDAPAFHRNHAPIRAVLVPLLADKRGDVLEVGAGTGQHAVEFARALPDIAWWPSDASKGHLHSIAAWRAHSALPNLQMQQRIDLTDPAWTPQHVAGQLQAIVCINVLHISPWTVSQNLISGAARLLHPDGLLAVYGPFMRDGAQTAPSNAAFDQSLRAENPEWGVRDVGDLAALARDKRLTLAEPVAMPANNLILIFRRAV